MLTTSGQMRLVAANTSGVVTASKTLNKPFSLDNGTSSGQANAFFYGTMSVAPGATVGSNTATINLSVTGNALFGGTAGFSVVKAITLVNQSTTSAVTLQPSGGATQWPYLATMTLAPGAAVSLFSPIGWQVSTNPTIRIASVDTSVTVTGTTTVNSAIVSGISSTTGIAIGQQIAGAGIASNTTVVSVTNTSVTLSQVATAAGTASLTAGWPDAVVEASIVGLLSA